MILIGKTMQCFQLMKMLWVKIIRMLIWGGCEVDDDVIIDMQCDVDEDKYDGDGESLDDDYIPSDEEGLNLKIKTRMNVLTTLIVIINDFVLENKLDYDFYFENEWRLSSDDDNINLRNKSNNSEDENNRVKKGRQINLLNTNVDLRFQLMGPQIFEVSNTQ